MSRQPNANSINADVAASIMKSQSIVVPTLAHNAMTELHNRTGNMKVSNPFDTLELTETVKPIDTWGNTGRDSFKEEAQLVGMIKAFLKRRLEFQPDGNPATILDISAHVQHVTGNSWTNYWESIHGPLFYFAMNHPESFTVLQNEFVVLNNSVSKYPPPGFQYPSEPYTETFSSPPPAIGFGPDLNRAYLEPPHQTHQPLPMYNTYESMNPFTQLDYGAQHQYYSPPPMLDPQMHSTYPNVLFPTGNVVPLVANDGWALFDDPPIEPVNPFSSGEIDDGFLPKKSKRKEERLEKVKQEEEDEKFARKLQDAEYASSGSTQERSFDSNSDQLNRLVLSHTEVRELAEAEIGKDNIRIMAGFSVIKFGREGRPHQRKMWINSALTHLAWESSQFDGNHRGLELSQVTRIGVGELTPTIRRATKDSKKVKNLCFSLFTESRTLDIQACSVIQRDSLAAALTRVVEFNHKHTPRRVDKFQTELSI